MPPTFVHCPSCDRHVRSTDASCPFCQSAMPPAPAAAPRGVSKGPITRAALLFAGATAAASCGTSTGADGGTDTVVYNEQVAAYGPVPVDVVENDAAPDVTPDLVAMYGPVPVDAQSNDAARDIGPDLVAAYGPVPVDR